MYTGAPQTGTATCTVANSRALRRAHIRQGTCFYCKMKVIGGFCMHGRKVICGRRGAHPVTRVASRLRPLAKTRLGFSGSEMPKTSGYEYMIGRALRTCTDLGARWLTGRTPSRCCSVGLFVVSEHSSYMKRRSVGRPASVARAPAQRRALLEPTRRSDAIFARSDEREYPVRSS